MTARDTILAAAVAVAVAALAGPVLTGDRQAFAAADASSKPSDSPPEAQLTPEERAEKDGRKACKAAICAAFRGKKTDGGDIACDIVKSWRKEQLTKLVAKMKVTWPYAGVRCTSAVKLKRADLVKAVSEAKSELQLDKHEVACVVARDKDAPTDIKIEFSPKVSFENGKATKAQINWGKIEGPAVIKSALWTATAADNTVNLLSGTLVEDINDFVDKKCDEVKDDWASK